MIEYVICGASLPTICTGEEPPEEIRQRVNDVFSIQLEDGYRILPRIENQGTDDEMDRAEDGTYRVFPTPILTDEVLLRGAVICNACYCTLQILTPSGAGLTHELSGALREARSRNPADLPRVG